MTCKTVVYYSGKLDDNLRKYVKHVENECDTKVRSVIAIKNVNTYYVYYAMVRTETYHKETVTFYEDEDDFHVMNSERISLDALNEVRWALMDVRIAAKC